MSRTIRLTLQYLGTRFHGWQVQPGRPTVQGIVQETLGGILGETVRIVGAGRTDAGVHARGQVASFRTASAMPAETIGRAANALLPWEIRVLEAVEAPEGFHALSSARGKDYRYQIWTGEILPPFLHELAAHCHAPLDAARFAAGAALLLGKHDFTGLSATGSSAATPVRTVRVSDLSADGPLWVYRIEADGFLYRMVRLITGTLVEIARGRWEPARIDEIFERKDPALAGPAMPPRGLFLEKVLY